MKSLGNWVVFGGMAAIFLASCFDPPEYSNIPAIEFESVTFIDVAKTSDADSLILVVRFKDGDGNMGLDGKDPLDTLYPYQSRTFFDTVNSNVGYYYPFKNGPFITYKTKRTNPAYDTLPGFEDPFNCVNWEIVRFSETEVDTFYFQRNANHYNIFVDYLVKNNDGTFSEFDWTKEFAYPQCGITFDGRFPILSKDLSKSAALDGRIRYSMTSTGFLILFSIKTLKLRVTIQDRLLNKSNVVESQEFTLQQIKKTG
ncbi:MAG: hypothetical protein JNK10_03795 [Cyclobacteriaceae bacterium]|nr:hypothetical protein [Cyclobacteriaceae bacterium]